ncbi:MAG: hypothetical protein J6J42_07175 [Lachnospiraceae bacterium]|nr:hypothetical protein [Lachnospiraceae bacterium]
MFKKVILGIGVSVAAIMISIAGLKMSENNADMKVDTQNIAGSYTEIVNGGLNVDWSTGMMGCDTRYKDMYTTTSSMISNTYDGKYKFVDSWCGPSDKTREESVTHGTERKTTFGGEKASQVFKMSASHEISDSSSSTVKLSFTFPGDMTTWNLYTTRRNINKLGYTSRTSYISELCYTYIWGIAAWDYEWSSYTRYPARDFSATKACDTVEDQYGHQMIRK